MKIKKYFGILVLIIILTMSMNSIFADSDFILELIDVNNSPTVSNLEIETENIQEICPTSKCEIEFINSSFIPPKPNNLTIAHTIDFNLIYNNTDFASDPIKKNHSEKFSESMNSCIVYDTINDKGREIYFCNAVTNTMSRISDSKDWYYDSNGIYDAIKNTYTVKGDLIDNFTS